MFGGDQRLVEGWERWKAGKEVEEWMKTVFKKQAAAGDTAPGPYTAKTEPPMFGGYQRLVKGWERWKAGLEVEEWMKTVFKNTTEPEPRRSPSHRPTDAERLAMEQEEVTSKAMEAF